MQSKQIRMSCVSSRCPGFELLKILSDFHRLTSTLSAMQQGAEVGEDFEFEVYRWLKNASELLTGKTLKQIIKQNE